MLRILVASAHLPKPDRASGDRRLVELLAILCRENRVDLYAPQVWDPPDVAAAYMARLRKIGVTVFPDAWRGVESALAFARYDVVIIEFWTFAEQLLDTIARWQPWAKIVIDTVDVHFLREETGLALGVSDAATVAANKTRELAVYRRADAVVAVTHEDRDGLAAALRDTARPIHLAVIPNIIPPRARRAIDRGPYILFVGGFAHVPNIDGICWFTREAWPMIRTAFPKAALHIVGSNPPDNVNRLRDEPGVTVHGYVSDLNPFLDEAAVSVAPLRYGGGMKGKVTEALSAAIPVVSTSIGARIWSQTRQASPGG